MRADAVIKWLRHYARTRLNSFLADQRRSLPPFALLDFGRAGLLGLEGDRHLGGLELDPTDCLRVITQLGAIDLALPILIGLHNFLAVRPIALHGGESVRKNLLPLLYRGHQLASYCLTEELAGSDPRRIRTRADLQPNGCWSISGKKIWSGAAAWSGVMLVFAQAFDGEKALGPCAFAVDQDTEGITQGPESLTMGLRSIIQNSVVFESAIVPHDRLVGRVGGGLEVAQETMAFVRLMLGAACLGGMARSVQLATRYAQRRTISSGSMLDNAVIVQTLDRECSRTFALQALLELLASDYEQGQLPAEALAAIKILAPDMLWATTDTCLQLLGGRGYVETNTIARILRDSRVFRILEGPTEAIAAHLGSALLHDPRPFLNYLSSNLDDPGRAGHLRESVDAARAACSKATGHLDRKRAQVVGQRLAMLASTALLASATKRIDSATDSSRVVTFAEAEWRTRAGQFEDCVTELPNMRFLLPIPVDGITAITGNIDEIGQNEDHCVDPFLALDAVDG